MATPSWWDNNEKGLERLKRMDTTTLLRHASLALARHCIATGVTSPTTKLILETALREGCLDVDVAQFIANGKLVATERLNALAKGIVALENGERNLAKREFCSASSAAAWLGLALCEKGEARRFALSRSVEMDPQLINHVRDLLPPFNKDAALRVGVLRPMSSTKATADRSPDDACSPRRNTAVVPARRRRPVEIK